MVNPLQKIEAEKARIMEEARRKADALDADARELARLAELAEKYGYSLVDAKAVQTPHHPPAEVDPAPPANSNGTAYRAAINAAENVIKAAGAPLELSVIFDACVDMGVPLAGKRPQSTLSAYLSHPASTVYSVRRGVYWLKGVDLPNGFSGLLPPTKLPEAS